MTPSGSRAQTVGIPVAVVLAALVAGAAVYVNVLAALALLGLIAFMVLLTEPALALPALIAASALDRYGPHWGDSNIRLDLLTALLIGAVLLNRILVRTVSPLTLRSPLVPALVAYAGANLLSTLLFAVERSRGLKLDVEIWTAVLTFVVTSALIRRKSDLTLVMRTLWIVTAGEAALGLAFAAAYRGHVSAYGVSEVATGFPAVYGTLWEPNVFGSFLAGNAFLLLADYIGHRRRGAYTYGLIVIFLGVGASLTRTVWIACVLGGAVYLLYIYRTRRAALPSSRAIGLGILALISVLALLSVTTPLGDRLLNIVNLHSSSAQGRIVWFQEAIREWSHAPILGSGTGSWTFGQTPGAPHAWLPSLFLLTLHDTGVVGFAALLWVIVVFYHVTLRGAHGSSELSLLAMGSAVGFSCLLVAFQTTTGFWFAYPWIVMVVGMSAARLRAEEP